MANDPAYCWLTGTIYESEDIRMFYDLHIGQPATCLSLYFFAELFFFLFKCSTEFLWKCFWDRSGGAADDIILLMSLQLEVAVVTKTTM